jgi:uncharacterized protein YcnI
VIAGAAIALSVVSATAASAHVEPSPSKIKAGATAVVTFTIPHGCSGSPTTGLDVQVPAAVTVFKPVAKTGWTSTVKGQVVTFAGGTLGAKVKGTFQLQVTAPKAVGPLDFKVIQRCKVGETDWIEVQKAGAAEPEHPAPRVTVVK